ncbi:hypothetical protein Clacol_008801 [Clathrus columnatus]|uniref:Uncharacterized protein n=1 Tax=Clathrus columnatus TaxID=1419009 RepID=A0AAV5AIR1_9AGAM|nr:hypothetical protein Clacol_008801 [Clathrus columnatus]
MVLPHEIYIDQLALSLGGCPLWGSLHPQVDPVDIGDVGYLSDNGGWIKLFNLRTETDSNGLPLNYQPGSLIVTDQDINRDIFKGPRYSNSVENLGGNFGVQGKVEAGLSYECAEEKGAILFVAEDAVTRDALNKSVFVKLIRDNIDNWVNFATEKGRNVKINDLILVTGYVRTTTWVAAVFARKSQSCKFTMGGVIPVADTGAKLQLWGSIHNVNAFAWTGGPEDRMRTGSPLDTTHFLKHMAPEISPPALLCKDDPRHQCVLVRGYRMANRNWRELLSLKKKTKQIKGIDVLKRNPRNSTGTFDNNDNHMTALPNPHSINSDIPNNTFTTNTTTTTTLPTDVYDQPLQQLTISDAVDSVWNGGENTEAGPTTPSDPDTNFSSEGHSSNHRDHRARRGQTRGDDSNQGLNPGNGRRDGGAGAGSSSGSRSSSGGSFGNFGLGRQSGSEGTANSRGQSTGTHSTSQRTSRNVDDDVELDELSYQWDHTTTRRNTRQKMVMRAAPSRKAFHTYMCLEDIQSDCESQAEYSSSDGENSVASRTYSSNKEVTLSPWEVFLEYLLKSEERADCAILHDDDFSVLPNIQVNFVADQ